MVSEIRVQSLVESYIRLKKGYLMPPCLEFTLGAPVIRSCATSGQKKNYYTNTDIKTHFNIPLL